jgi:hypothetical protein
MPQLPPNAQYVQHANECFDLGTIGWLAEKSGLVDYRRYASMRHCACSLTGQRVLR